MSENARPARFTLGYAKGDNIGRCVFGSCEAIGTDGRGRPISVYGRTIYLFISIT